MILDTQAEMERKIDEAIAAFKKLSPAQKLQRIREAGIIDEHGKLTPPYCRTMETENPAMQSVNELKENQVEPAK
jgi:Na+-translocating ferredoxin:NAD+ oxidoreductase RnfC subunit